MIKTRECYKEFSIHESLADAFSDERIPLLSMHQLRVKDYRITRKISYERTVSDFMMALNVNDSLRSLRNRQDIVVLLNEQGMLIREQGEWKLYFTPNKFERSTLADDAELYPVLESLDRKWEAGELAMSPVPYRGLKCSEQWDMSFIGRSIKNKYSIKKQAGRDARLCAAVL